MALPAVLEDAFKGLKRDRDGFTIIDSMHELESLAAAAVLLLTALGCGLYRLLRRWRRQRAADPEVVL